MIIDYRGQTVQTIHLPVNEVNRLSHNLSELLHLLENLEMYRHQSMTCSTGKTYLRKLLLTSSKILISTDPRKRPLTSLQSPYIREGQNGVTKNSL